MGLNFARVSPEQSGDYVCFFGGDPKLGMKLYFDASASPLRGQWFHVGTSKEAVFGPACGPDSRDDSWREVL